MDRDKMREEITNLLLQSETVDKEPPFRIIPQGNNGWAEIKADRILSLLAPVFENAEKWDAYQTDLINEKAHTERFIKLMDAEEGELRRKAEKWEKVEKLYPNVAAYITDPDEYTRKMKALKEST